MFLEDSLSNNVRINLDTYNQIRSKVEQLQHTSVVVGILGNTDSEILQRAIYTELGTSKMPSWGWLRKSVVKMKPQYKLMATQVFESVINNRTPNYESVGVWAAGRVKETIGIIRSPKLSEATIAEKGSSKPLIDSGQMRNSVSFEIRRG
jgi:hypothetical protein